MRPRKRVEGKLLMQINLSPEEKCFQKLLLKEQLSTSCSFAGIRMFLDVMLRPSVLHFLTFHKCKEADKHSRDWKVSPRVKEFPEPNENQFNSSSCSVLKSCRNEKLNFCRSLFMSRWVLKRVFNILSSENHFRLKCCRLKALRNWMWLRHYSQEKTSNDFGCWRRQTVWFARMEKTHLPRNHTCGI